MHDFSPDGTQISGTIDDLIPGVSITVDGQTHPLAEAANIDPGVDVGQHVTIVLDDAGTVTFATPDRPAQPPAPPPPPSEPVPAGGPADDEARMTLLEHLEELRQRLIRSVMALAIATVFSLIFAKRLLEALKGLLPQGAQLQAFTPTETYVVYFKVALLLGIALAMPVIVYQVLAFIVPGLTRQERRWLYFIVPGASVLFSVGLLFAYFVILPFGLPILQGFLSELVIQQWRLDYYISFVTRFLLITGLIFETPLLIYFLSKTGIVRPDSLARGRRYAIVVAAGLAAVLTPTTDPFTMLLVMGPLILLYEFGILLSKLA